MNNDMKFKNLTREELVEQLKALAADEEGLTVYPMSMGAMCYDPMPPKYKKTRCERCKKSYQISSWDESDYKSIVKVVEKIQACGVDARVERICHDCIKDLGIDYAAARVLDNDEEQEREELLLNEPGEGLEYVFNFKTKEQANYHVAIAPYSTHYQVVLAFLENQPFYEDSYDRTHFVRDEIHIIEQMTGITINDTRKNTLKK